MDANALTQLGGTALAVGVLIYMIHYFMQREAKREDFIAKVIEQNSAILRDNTKMICDNTSALRELKDLLNRKPVR